MKSTLGKGGVCMDQPESPLKEKIGGNPKEKTVSVKGPSPPMANHLLDLIFKP